MSAKKSFKEINPALQFISPPELEITDTEDDTATYVHKHTHTDAHTDTHASMHAGVYQDTPTHNKGPVFAPKAESKSKRLQLLLRPSTYAAIAALSRQNNTSVNETIHAILDDFLRP